MCPFYGLTQLEYENINHKAALVNDTEPCIVQGAFVQISTNKPHFNRHILPAFETNCDSCEARMCILEMSNDSFKNPIFSLCCSEGCVELPSIERPPSPLWELLNDKTKKGVNFRSNIRAYNTALAFTSMGANIYNNNLKNDKIFTFRISGQIYHRIGPLIPNDNQPKFSQIYIYDTANELKNRMKHINNVDENVMLSLQDMMHANNPYVKLYKHAYETLQKNQDLKLIIKNDPNVDRRRNNAPTAPDIAAILPESQVNPRHIVVHYKSDNNNIYRISELNSAYDPLHYVLMHARGQQGYELGIKKKDSDLNITATQFYSHRLMLRTNNYIGYFGRLLKQYVVDMYVKIEHARLKYLRHNQQKLRVESYKLLSDALLQGFFDASSIGKKLILPSSFIGIF